MVLFCFWLLSRRKEKILPQKNMAVFWGVLSNSEIKKTCEVCVLEKSIYFFPRQVEKTTKFSFHFRSWLSAWDRAGAAVTDAVGHTGGGDALGAEPHTGAGATLWHTAMTVRFSGRKKSEKFE